MNGMEWLLGIGIGIGLAAASGLRVFVPLLALSIAGRFFGVSLTGSFAWVGTTPALVAFAVATVVEIAAYSVPWLDNVLDHLAAPLAVTAGIVMTAAVLGDAPPLLRWALAIVAGGGVAGTVHASTAVLRGISSVTTGGLGNPFVALLEAAGSIVMAILAIVVPALAVVVVVVLLVLAARGLARFSAARRVPRTAA